MNPEYVPAYNEDPMELETAVSAVYFKEVDDSKTVHCAWVRVQPLIIGFGFSRQAAIDSCMQSWRDHFTSHYYTED